MFKVHYSLIHNRGCCNYVGLSQSPKAALKVARNAAWRAFDRSGATNWADVFLTITNPYGEVIYNDFAPCSALLKDAVVYHYKKLVHSLRFR
jgi:hypothetical protein